MPEGACGFEIGCGSGRFAQFVAPQVGLLTCVDAAPDAIRVAKATLAPIDNVTFINGSVGDLALPSASFDFGYSYGVLHHVPDTMPAIQTCVDLLKPGAPFLIYLYYSMDNKPLWFKAIWWLSNPVRIVVSRLPMGLRNFVSDVIALGVYFPLAKLAALASALGINTKHFPLADFQKTTIARMRSNSRDRFGTPLEQRFSRQEIEDMMTAAGLKNIAFREGRPFWCAVGVKG